MNKKNLIDAYRAHLDDPIHNRKSDLRLVAPDTNHEVHGQQHQLEEDEKEHQVAGYERACHTGGQEQDQDQEGLRIVWLWPVIPRIDDCQHDDECGKHHQWQADSINPDGEIGVDRRYPLQLVSKLHIVGSREVELEDGHHAQKERDQRRHKGNHFGGALFFARDSQQDGGSNGRYKDNEGQPPTVLKPFHFLPS